MANKPLKSITFPGLSDTYTIPQIDTTLTQSGQAADSKTVGDELGVINAFLGVETKSFSVGSGETHSSLRDRMNVNVSQATKAYLTVTIKLSDSTAEYPSIAVYAYEEGNNQGIPLNVPRSTPTLVTILPNYKYVGVYTGTATCGIEVSIKLEYVGGTVRSALLAAGLRGERYIPALELGNINISTSGWSYGVSANRVRMPEGVTLPLKQGDIISLSDYTDARIYIGWLNSNNEYKVNGWRTSDYVLTEDGQYVFCLSNRTERAQESADELGSLLSIVHAVNSNDVVYPDELADILSGDNVKINVKSYSGYLDATGKQSAATVNKERYTDYIPVDEDTKISVEQAFSEARVAWFCYATYDSYLNFIGRITLTGTEGTAVQSISREIKGFASNVSAIRLTYRTYDDLTISTYYKKQPNTYAAVNVKSTAISSEFNSVITHQNKNTNIRVVNHRGYNGIAPENTMSAFKLSVKNGFKYIEMDVNFTSDDVPVVIHDSTVDRTSNGTGAVNSFTYEEIRALDFGSWKSAEYTGEKIPSLEEFLLFCKYTGVHPYIEIKSDGYWTSKSHASILADTVKKTGMGEHCTLISFDSTYLDDMKQLLPKARYGLLCNAIDTSVINWCTGLIGDGFDAFVDAAKTLCVETNEGFVSCMTNNIPVEAWTLTDSIAEVSAYVSGYTTNYGIIWAKLYDDAME